MLGLLLPFSHRLALFSDSSGGYGRQVGVVELVGDACLGIVLVGSKSSTSSIGAMKVALCRRWSVVQCVELSFSSYTIESLLSSSSVTVSTWIGNCRCASFLVVLVRRLYAGSDFPVQIISASTLGPIPVGSFDVSVVSFSLEFVLSGPVLIHSSLFVCSSSLESSSGIGQIVCSDWILGLGGGRNVVFFLM